MLAEKKTSTLSDSYHGVSQSDEFELGGGVALGLAFRLSYAAASRLKCSTEKLMDYFQAHSIEDAEDRLPITEKQIG